MGELTRWVTLDELRERLGDEFKELRLGGYIELPPVMFRSPDLAPSPAQRIEDMKARHLSAAIREALA